MRQSTYQAYPRYLCPTEDDADGLRVMYPVCDKLLPCETIGGADFYDTSLYTINDTTVDGTTLAENPCYRWTGEC